MSEVCYVALSYDSSDDGHLRVAQVSQCETAEDASAAAHQLGRAHAGAIAFSRVLDLRAGRCGGAKLLLKIGRVPNLSYLLGRAA